MSLAWRTAGLSTKSGMSYRCWGSILTACTCRFRFCGRFIIRPKRGPVAGPKPTDDPSLADDQAEFE